MWYDDRATNEHDVGMDAFVMPHYPTAALLTVDTQIDTLDGQPLEIPGTSEVVPNIAMLSPRRTAPPAATGHQTRCSRSSKRCDYAEHFATDPSNHGQSQHPLGITRNSA